MVLPAYLIQVYVLYMFWGSLVWNKIRPDILMEFLEEYFENVDFENSRQMTKKWKNYPACKELSIFDQFVFQLWWYHTSQLSSNHGG